MVCYNERMAKELNPDYIYTTDSKGRRRAFVKKPCAYCSKESLIRPKSQYCSYSCSAKGRDVARYLPDNKGENHYRFNSEAKYHGISEAVRTTGSVPEGTYRERGLLHRYGISQEQFDSMLAAQGGKCLFCNEPLTKEVNAKGRSMWHVDHDHACCPGAKTCGNCVRGILCNQHNLILGWSKDAPNKLRAMADYIEAHRNRIAGTIEDK